MRRTAGVGMRWQVVFGLAVGLTLLAPAPAGAQTAAPACPVSGTRVILARDVEKTDSGAWRWIVTYQGGDGAAGCEVVRVIQREWQQGPICPAGVTPRSDTGDGIFCRAPGLPEVNAIGRLTQPPALKRGEPNPCPLDARGPVDSMGSPVPASAHDSTGCWWFAPGSLQVQRFRPAPQVDPAKALAAASLVLAP